MLSSEYCFVVVSLEYVAVKVTFLFVGRVMSALTLGAAGGVLSMLLTVQIVTLEMLPASSRPRK